MSVSSNDEAISAHVRARLDLYQQEVSLSPGEREELAAKWIAQAVEERDAKLTDATRRKTEAEAQMAKAEEAARVRRQDEQAREDQRIRNWYVDQPVERNKLTRKILKHLLSAEGRNGPDSVELADILDWDLRHVQACIDALKPTGGVKEHEGQLYHHKVWRGLHPERRGQVKHIGTKPQAVIDHPECNPARESVARALSGHFYRNRTAHAKARAIGIRELAESAKVAKQTADDAIRWLLTTGLLERVTRGVGRRGSIYRWSAQTKLYKPKRKTKKPIS